MAVGGVDAVRILGTRELLRQLRHIDADFGTTVRLLQKDIAQEIADAAKSEAMSQGSTIAKGAASIRANASQRAAMVVFGGARYPYMKGAEFGSVRYRQFKDWRGSGEGAGYAIFPTIRSMRQRIKERATQFVNDLIESIGA